MIRKIEINGKIYRLIGEGGGDVDYTLTEEDLKEIAERVKFSTVVEGRISDGIGGKDYDLEIGAEYKFIPNVLETNIFVRFGGKYMDLIYKQDTEPFTLKVIGSENKKVTYEYNGELLTKDYSGYSDLGATYASALFAYNFRGAIYRAVGDGKTPEKGIDYFTPEDVETIVNEVAENVTTARIGTVTISADKWTGTSSPYAQEVTVEGATKNSQVDLTPSDAQLAIFHEKDLAFVTSNYRGVVTVSAIGQKPMNDYEMQVTITEVEHTDENSPIIGVTVGTPISPSKIEEKINPVKTVNNVAPDENGNVAIEIPQGANGKTPYIKDGNWWIGETDTGVKAEGEDGKDYVLTSTDKTEIAEQAVNLIDGVPNYVKNEAESVIDRVLSAQGNKTFTFAVMTDMHYGNDNYKDGIKHACQALKYIDERVKLDTIVILGDYTDGYPTTNIADAMMDFKGINAMLDKLRFAPNLRQMGNHDYYADNIPITRRLIQYYSDEVVWGSKIGGYFYKDFDDYNIRAICINTIENDNSNISVSKQQYEWFINSLDLSQKENATDWQIVIFSHHPVDWWVVDSKYRFGQIIHAYKNGSAFSDNEISCNFASKNSAVLIGNIHGHIHNLLTDTIYFTNKNNAEKTSVYRLCTPNACFGRENQYDGWYEETTYSKTQNSADDTAFVIYCVNLDTHIMKAICYGAGYDRELDYINGISTVSYNVQYNLTNVTSSNTSANIQNGKPYSTTLSADGDIKSVTVTMNGIDITSSVYTNGTITIDSVTGNIVITAVAEEVEKIVNLLDTVGYTDGMRFSGSNGVEKADEVCMATGYIEVSNLKSGDHIYGWGIDFNNANNSGKCVIVSYDDSKNILGQNLLNQNSSIANLKVSFDAENRLDISYNGTPVAKYIRFSGVGTGANAVVTRNQLPID